MRIDRARESQQTPPTQDVFGPTLRAAGINRILANFRYLIRMEIPIDTQSLCVERLTPGPPLLAGGQATDTKSSMPEALMLALNDSFVFAAAVGPRASGKTRIFATVVKNVTSANKICIGISSPETITSEIVSDMNVVLQKAVSQTSALSIKVVFAVDDAHKATDKLLQMLTRIASQRHSAVITQVIFFGLPSLLTRLRVPEYQALESRIAVRCHLRGLASPKQLSPISLN